jgi:hypothetical protein
VAVGTVCGSSVTDQRQAADRADQFHISIIAQST